MMEYKGYFAEVEYDDSVKEFVGFTVNMRDVLSFGGTTVEELERAFHETVDTYLDWCKSDAVDPDKPYMGSISLRVPPAMHRDLDSVAKSMGISVNKLLQNTIADVIDENLSARG